MKKLYDFELGILANRCEYADKVEVNADDLRSMIDELMSFRAVKENQEGRYIENFVRMKQGENPAEFLIRVITECQPPLKE